MPGVDADVASLVEFDDGHGPRLVFGGSFISAGERVCNHVASFDGSAWSPLGAGTNDNVGPMLVFDDGSGPALYVGGSFTQAGGVTVDHVARWNGTSWSAVGSGLGASVNSLCVYDDGTGRKLYAGGTFAGGIARWSGSQWNVVGNGLTNAPNNVVAALAVYDDGIGPRPALYAAGQFHASGAVAMDNVARWDGVAWSSPQNGCQGGVVALTVFDDGTGARLFAGGTFGHASGVPVNNVARWNGTTWSAAGASPSVHSFSVYDDGQGARLFAAVNQSTLHGVRRWEGAGWTDYGPPIARVNVLRDFDDGSGNKLYAGGSFLSVNNVPSYHVARLSGPAWAPLTTSGAGITGEVYSMTSHDDGSGAALYVSGLLTNQIPSLGVLRWNGSSWTNLSGWPQYAFALASYDDGLGGGAKLFASSSGMPGTPYENAVFSWDGTAWGFVGGNTNPFGGIDRLVVLDDGSGKHLYATGEFQNFVMAGGAVVQTPRIARWDGTTWSGFPVGPNTSSYVLALTAYDDGLGGGPSIVTGGGIGPGFPGVARWNGTSWVPLGTGVNGTIEDFIVFDDASGRQLYACGTFTTAGGAPVHGVARWNGTTWSDVGGGTIPALGATFSRVTTFAVFDDGTGHGAQLYAEVAFTLPGGETGAGVARWDGSSWSVDGKRFTISGDPFLLPNDLLVVVDSGQGADLWAGGNFRAVGGDVAASDIARWRACDRTGETFCAGDGSASACPCGNASMAGSGAGCVNSLGRAGALTATGVASTMADTLVLHGSGMTNGACLYFQGTARANGGAGMVFGDGLRCVAGTIVRLGIRPNVGGSSQYPGPADARVSTKGADHAGDLRQYQTWYRDASAFCTSATFDLTNGVSILWIP